MFDRTWIQLYILDIVGIFVGFIGFIIGLILLFMVENKLVGGIILVISTTVLLTIIYMRGRSQRELDPINNS